jgi:predicted XRE-type DNA-binding protein
MKSNRIVTRTSRQLARALSLEPEDALEIEVRASLVEKIVVAVTRGDLTHGEVAKLAGTSRSRVTAILNGNIQGVSTDLLLRILGKLGYRARLIFTRAA